MPLSGLPDLALTRPGRVHEAAGAARRAFAAALAGRLAGPVLWIVERRGRETLCPQGLAPLLEPSRLILARPAGARAVLQVAEEALRSGAATLVVAELEAAPDLTASRRLQLAADAGGGRGLCLVPEAGLRPSAAETRWLCAPLPGGPARQRWELVRNKRGRPGKWEVWWDVAREVAWEPGGEPGGEPGEQPGAAPSDRHADPARACA